MFGIDQGSIDLPQLLSGADLSAAMHLFGKLSGGKIIPCAVLGEQALGVIYGNPAAADRPCPVRVQGYAEVTAGEALTADWYVTPGANGRAYHAVGAALPAGRVLVGTTGAAQRALVKLLDVGQHSAQGLYRISHTVDLANIADGNILSSYLLPFAGRIESFSAIVETPASTPEKLSTLNLEIGGTDCTGGVLALTTANMTPIGAVVASTAFTAGHTFAAGASLDIEASSTTTFIEGRVRLEIIISASTAGQGLYRVSHTVDLANIANGNILTGYPMPFTGRIESFSAIVEKATTVGAKAANINLELGGTNVTGGVIGLTSANMTPVGAVVASSAITALNTFAAGALLDIEASSTTAFSDGRVRLEIILSASA